MSIRKAAISCSLAVILAASVFIFFLTETPTFGVSQKETQTSESTASAAPDPATIPEGPLGDSIRLGLHVFNETPKYAAQYVGNKMSCSHCHVDGGTVSGGMPMIGVPGLFPMYRDREKTVITFEERIEQCFQRSENGHRVPNTSPEMVGLVAYSQWLSKDQVTGRPFPGRGLVNLPELNGDINRGEQIYSQQCAVCHGADGAGKPPAIPAVWGPDAYSDGAGMHNISRMAPFVQHNMPQNNPRSLTAQQSYDVAAFIHDKPHVPFHIEQHQ